MDDDAIFEFIKQQETAYSLPISVIDGWEWSMKDHIKMATLYKNSQFLTGNSPAQRDDKPFENIVRPLLNLQYRSEGFDVKDINLYVNSSKDYYKYFLVKKFHDKWARKNEIDTFIDEMVESYVDYGGVLVKDINDVKPEVQPMQSIAFCDQSNMLGGPIGFKHFYSPNELQEFSAKGWGDPKNNATVTIDEAIVLAGEWKVPDATTGTQVKTPGKYIEVYEVHGVMKESWLKQGGSADKYVRQMQIILFYTDDKNKRKGLRLFAGKEKNGLFKQLIREKIYGRALGFGGVEELAEAQVWTNYDHILIKGLLDQASRVLYKTTDQTFKNRNKTNDLENGEIMVIEDGKDIQQINTTPANITLFERSITEWSSHAQEMASANAAALGTTVPKRGVSFQMQAFVAQQQNALHNFRQGKIAVFMDEIYRDWVIQYIVKELEKGQEFLDDLSLDEMQNISDAVVTIQVNNHIKNKILSGLDITPQEVDMLKQQVKQDFLKNPKRFLQIFEGEMKNADIDVNVSIANKQKDLSAIATKLTSIFSQIIANPQVLNDPRMAKIFNAILESVGLDPIEFGAMNMPAPASAPAPTPPQPVIPTQETAPAA